MDQDLTAKDAARLIAGIIVYDCGGVTGEIAYLADIMPAWIKKGLGPILFQHGLEFARDNGWIKEAAGGYRLTPEGIDARTK
ncbi:MAG: hypothetical protein M3O74_13840 [Pseudomonadota bacterium]|nr:hypothetical protein [Pseudomonadota bacterium]